MKIKRYFKIYLVILKINLTHLFIYRANLINNVISSLAWGMFSIITMLLFTSQTKQVLSWSREELMFLTATYAVLIGIFHTLFSRNFDRLSQIIHYGELDSLLVKPMDSQFTISFWLVNYAALMRLIIGVGLMIYLIINGHWVISWYSVVYFCIMIGIGVISLYSVWLIFMTLIIWQTHLYNLVDLMYTVSGFGRMPKELYQETIGMFSLIILPVVLAINVPAKAMLDKPISFDVLILLMISIVLFVFSRKFWKFGLKYYTSASG
jgi:ABC-2 type transport system permease protein